MILFIFEGKQREPKIFNTLKHLFFSEEQESLICCFGNDIYDLYKQLKSYDDFGMTGGDGDTVAVFNEILTKRGDNTLKDKKSSDFSEIYLFFDYDFHDANLSLPELNEKLKEMLAYFYDETENGKLYINYPMVESIRYTKELPDAEYYTYKVERKKCHNFKNIAQEFSHYGSFDFILIDERNTPTAQKETCLRRNWQHLKDQNVSKANFICHGNNSYPKDKSYIGQEKIFESQLLKYVNTECCCAAILNAFPIFLYEYFK